MPRDGLAGSMVIQLVHCLVSNEQEIQDNSQHVHAAGSSAHAVFVFDKSCT